MGGVSHVGCCIYTCGPLGQFPHLLFILSGPCTPMLPPARWGLPQRHHMRCTTMLAGKHSVCPSESTSRVGTDCTHHLSTTSTLLSRGGPQDNVWDPTPVSSPSAIALYQVQQPIVSSPAHISPSLSILSYLHPSPPILSGPSLVLRPLTQLEMVSIKKETEAGIY